MPIPEVTHLQYAILGALMDGLQNYLVANLFFITGEAVGLVAAIIFVIRLQFRPKSPLGIVLFIYHFFYAFWNVVMLSISAYKFPEQYVTDGFSILFTILGFVIPTLSTYIAYRVLISTNERKPDFKNKVGRGYLWVMLIFTGILPLFLISEIMKWTLYDYASFLSIAVLATGIYSYLTKRILFPIVFWKTYFWINIIWAVLELFLHSEFGSHIVLPTSSRSFVNQPIPLMEYLLYSIIFLPLYYPMYKIAFDKKFFKKDKRP